MKKIILLVGDSGSGKDFVLSIRSEERRVGTEC